MSTTKRDLKTHTPGETTTPAAGEGATEQPQRRDAIVVPASVNALTAEELAAAVATLQAQVSTLQSALGKKVAESPDNVKLPTIEEAKDKAEALLADGFVPPAILTDKGHYVHPMAHSSTEQVQSYLENKARRDEGKVARAKTADKSKG